MDTASSVSWSNPAAWLHLIREAFQEAGFTSYIALLAFVVIAASLSRVQGIASERKQPWLPLVLTDIPLLIGVVGYMVAMSNVHDALVAVDPSMRAVLAERGQQVAETKELRLRDRTLAVELRAVEARPPLHAL